MAFTSQRTKIELLSPVDGSVLVDITTRGRSASVSCRPTYASRGYHRNAAVTAARLRTQGTVTLQLNADDLALLHELERWQKGVVWYPMAADLKGKRYRQPDLRITFLDGQGAAEEVVRAYGVKLADESLDLGMGPAKESISLDVLGGFDTPADTYEPVRALDFARTGPATYLSLAGTLTTAGDGEARIGFPGAVARRNLYNGSNDFTPTYWSAIRGSLAQNQAVDPDGTSTAHKWTATDVPENYLYRSHTGEASATYVLSAHIKRGSGADYAHFMLWDTTSPGNGVRIWFNIVDGTVGTSTAFGSGFSATGSVQSLGDGWYRLVAVFATGTTTQKQARISLSVGNGNTNGVAGAYCYIWQAQFEKGSAVTPIQPTNAIGVDLTHPLNGAGLVLEGSFTNSLDNPDTPATQTKSLAAGTYTVYLDGAGSVAVTGTGITTVSGATPATNAIPYTFSLAGTQSITFTVSGTVTRFGCVNLPWRPSHITGTKQPDLCGIVPPHNELLHSHDLTQTAWTKAAGASVTKSGTANTLTLAATTDSITQAVTPPDVPGTTRTIAVRLRLGTLTGSVRLRLLDQSGNQIASTTISTAGLSATDARTFTVTGTPGGSVTGLRIQLIGNAGTGTVIVESMRLVRGWHPGIEVQTGDTPIYAPASPALDPAWSQNGRLTGSFVLPVGANTATGTVILGGGGLTITQKASTIELSRTTAAGTRTISVAKNAATGTPMALDASWSHYTDSAGVRKMILALTVDGATSTADVAALYGDTSFADLDASRLVSAGSVFATWRDLKPTWPVLPAGVTPQP